MYDLWNMNELRQDYGQQCSYVQNETNFNREGSWQQRQGRALVCKNSPLLVFKPDGSLMVLYTSSDCDLLLIILALLWTSQSATLLCTDITSVGVVATSVGGGFRCWRKENLVTWSLIFIFPGVHSSNSMVKEAWLWTTGGVGVEGTHSVTSEVSFVGTSWTWDCDSVLLGDRCWNSFVGISK